jgi:hypothetical protein
MLSEIKDLSRIERSAGLRDAEARRSLGAQRALIVDAISLTSVRHFSNDGDNETKF